MKFLFLNLNFHGNGRIYSPRSDKPEILVEIKYSTTSKPSRGFYVAQEDLGTQKHYVICPVEMGFPLSETVEVLGINEIFRLFDRE